MQTSIDSHDYDEKKKISLKDFSKNDKEKLADLSDEELSELKKQAIEEEDYDIAKMIKQEQDERKEKVPETEESQELDWQAKREEARKDVSEKIQGEKDASREENLKKADDLIFKLNGWDKWNNKDELAGLLPENQKWYNTLSDNEKKQFRIMYDMGKILDSYEDSIQKYQEESHDLDLKVQYWYSNPNSLQREFAAHEEKARSIANHLDTKIQEYNMLHGTQIEDAKMQKLFSELKDLFNKGLFQEMNHTTVFKEMVDVLQDIKKSTENEKSFKSTAGLLR